MHDIFEVVVWVQSLEALRLCSRSSKMLSVCVSLSQTERISPLFFRSPAHTNSTRPQHRSDDQHHHTSRLRWPTLFNRKQSRSADAKSSAILLPAKHKKSHPRRERSPHTTLHYTTSSASSVQFRVTESV